MFFLKNQPARNFCYATFGLFVFIIGCNIQDIDLDNFEVENFQSELAIPIGTTTYTMREFIENISDPDLLLEDAETTELILIYRDTANYALSSEIFDVQNISNTSIVNLPDTPDNGMTRTVSVTLPFSQTYESVKGEVIDSVFHAVTSSLTVDLVSTSTLSIAYDLELVNTTNVNTGTAVQFSGTLSGGGEMSHDQGLANHKTTFTEVVGENHFNVNLTVHITLSAGQSLSNDQISVTIGFLDQDFIIAFGKLGQDTVSITSESIDISFFDDLGVYGLEFISPEISFDFRNSFGIPIGIGLGGVYSEEKDGTRTYLTGDIVATPPVIEGSSVEAPVTGEIQQTTININSSNSTLQKLWATSPLILGFDVKGFTNPYDPTTLNFVTDTSSITSYTEVAIPMEVRLIDVQHTVDFDLDESEEFNEVDSLILRIITMNKFPFSATMDMFILDAEEDILYSVLENRVLDIPLLNMDRTVIRPKMSIDDVPFDKTGIDALNNGEKIRVTFTMNSPKSTTVEDVFVKLLATAKLEITLATRVLFDTKL